MSECGLVCSLFSPAKSLFLSDKAVPGNTAHVAMKWSSSKLTFLNYIVTYHVLFPCFADSSEGLYAETSQLT